MSADDAAIDDPQRVVCHLDRLLSERGMTLTGLAALAGVTIVNLSVLKNDRARAIRFSTLTAICDVLGCQPGDLLGVRPPHPDDRRDVAGTLQGRPGTGA